MTGQDWVIIAATWGFLAVILAGTIADQRTINRRLARHRDELNNHARRLLALEHGAHQPPTATHTEMPTIRPPARGGIIRHPPRLAHEDGCEVTIQRPPQKRPSQPIDPRSGRGMPDPAQEQQEEPTVRRSRAMYDPDQTLRLKPPSICGDIAAALAAAKRPLTRSQLAARTGLEPWEVNRQLQTMYVAGTAQIVATHDTDRAWKLTDTTRMPNGMPLLPGTSR